MAKTYTTKSGDQWDGIAYRELGSVDGTDRLMNANLAHRDYFIFPAGVVLTLPEIRRPVSGSLPPWKTAGGAEKETAL